MAAICLFRDTNIALMASRENTPQEILMHEFLLHTLHFNRINKMFELVLNYKKVVVTLKCILIYSKLKSYHHTYYYYGG